MKPLDFTSRPGLCCSWAVRGVSLREVEASHPPASEQACNGIGHPATGPAFRQGDAGAAGGSTGRDQLPCFDPLGPARTSPRSSSSRAASAGSSSPSSTACTAWLLRSWS